MKSLLFIFVVLMSVSAFAERYGFDRYECILKRRMFGAVPPGFDPSKKPSEVAKTAGQKELTQEQEKLQSAIHFSVINVTPEGNVMVGFTDNSNGKEPCHYYLKVGDQRDGWLVKEADTTADPQTMTIVKDGVEVSLSIGGDSSKGGGTTVRSGTSASAAAPTSRIEPQSSAGYGHSCQTLNSRMDQKIKRGIDEGVELVLQKYEKKEQERKKRIQDYDALREQELADAMTKAMEKDNAESSDNETSQNGEGSAGEEN